MLFFLSSCCFLLSAFVLHFWELISIWFLDLICFWALPGCSRLWLYFFRGSLLSLGRTDIGSLMKCFRSRVRGLWIGATTRPVISGGGIGVGIGWIARVGICLRWVVSAARWRLLFFGGVVGCARVVCWGLFAVCRWGQCCSLSPPVILTRFTVPFWVFVRGRIVAGCWCADFAVVFVVVCCFLRWRVEAFLRVR